MKKVLLFLTFILFCFPWGAKAQTQAQATLTVHDGTTLYQQVPVNFLWWMYYTRSQFVIPATELTELEGNPITSITFYTTTNYVPYTSSTSAEVYVKEVNYTNITDFESNSGATTVYYDVITIDHFGRMTIEFNNSYVYQGGNLLIGIENISKDVQKMIYFYGENVSWTSAVSGHDYSSWESVTAIYQRNFLPKTTFTYTPLCHKPTGLSATLDSYNGTIATLSWTARNNVTSWDIYYKKTSDADYTEILNVTQNSYTLSDLEPNTQYQYHVVANCSGSEMSDASSDFSFTTGCGVLSLPQTFDFDSSYDHGTLPECWTGGGEAFVVREGWWYGVANSGSRALGFACNFPTFDRYSIVALPKIEVPSTGLRVNFWVHPYGNSGWTALEVGYITDDDFSTWNLVASFYYNDWSGISYYNYKEKTVDLPNIPANGRIVFHSTSENDYDYNSWVVDDITITAIPCKEPTGLQVDAVSVHAATLSWTNGAEGQSAWQIAYSTDADFDPDTVSNPVDVTSNPATINGLAANTKYYAYVRANCDIVGYSDWVGPVSFTTLVDCPAPTAVAANSITMHTADLNWTNPNATPDSYNVRYRKFEDGTSFGEWVNDTANESPKHLAGLAAETRYEAQVQSNCGPEELGQWTAPHFFTTVAGNLPPTDLAVSDITPSLATASWTGIATNEHHQSYELYISTESTVPTAPSVTGVTESSYTFTGLAYSTQYYVWVRDYCGDDGYSSWTGPVDFVTLPSCPAPKLTAEGITNVTAHTADVAWTGYTENDGGYVVRYRTAAQPGTVYLSEDFEGGSMPEGWSQTSNYWSVGSGTGHSDYTGSANGNYNATCYISPANSRSDILITPAMNLSSASNATLSFNFRNKAWGSDLNKFNVFYRVNEGEWQLLYENSVEQSSWTTTPITVELTGLADHYQIGFKCTTGSGYNDYGFGTGIDDILVYAMDDPGLWQTVTPNPTTTSTQLTGLDAETDYEVQVFGVCSGETEEVGSDTVVFTTLEVCPAPTAFTLDAVTSNEAAFSWTAGGTETAWQLYISTTNTAPDDDIAATAQGLYAASENPFFLINGLDPVTEYYVRVRANCGGTDGNSKWTGSKTFTTLNDSCDIKSFDITTNGIRRGDAVINAETHTVTMPVYNTTDFSGAAGTITFSTGAIAKMRLDANSEEWNCYITNFNTLRSHLHMGDTVVRVYAQDPTIYQDWTIIMQGEACSTPFSISFVPERTSFTANWVNTDPAAENYQVICSNTRLTTDDADASNNKISVLGANTYTFTGLERETKYYVYVRTDCGNDGFSEWKEDSVITKGLTFCEDVVVADGGISLAGNRDNRTVPLWGYHIFEAQHSQMIYPASMLTELQGKTITGIKYFVSSGNISSWNAYDYYPLSVTFSLAITTNDNLSSGWDETSGTAVFTGAFESDGSITFTTPFTYSGGNLLVDINMPTGAVYSRVGFYGQTATDASRNAFGSELSGSGTIVGFLPKVSFHYCETNEACPAVTEVEASEITDNSATISWEASSGDYVSGYQVILNETELTADQLEGYTGSYTYVGTATTCNLNGLNAYTSYYVYVRAICQAGGHDEGYSDWTSSSFTTPGAMPPVLNLTVTEITHTAISVTWERNVAQFADETAWQVAVVEHGASFPTLWRVTHNMYFTFIGLTPETSYDIYVRPYQVDPEEYGAAVSILDVTTLPLPDACEIVADGTATSGIVPIYANGADQYNRYQMIYTSEDLAALAGKSINSMTFYLSSPAADSWGNANFVVKLVEVNNTTFSNTTFINTDDVDTLYNGSLDGTQSTMTVNFTTPFQYNGSNLLVEFTQNVKGTYKVAEFYGQNATGASIGGNSNDGVAAISPQAQNFKPKVQFCYEAGDCRDLTRLTISDITTNSAHVSWLPGNSEDIWVYVNSTQMLDEETLNSPQTQKEAIVNEVEIDLTGLTTGTDYWFYMRPLCAITPSGNVYGNWTMRHFQTPPYIVTVEVNPSNAGITVTGTGVYTNGQTAHIAPENAVGYHIVNWTDANDSELGTGDYIDINVVSDTTIIANFDTNSYALTIYYLYPDSSEASETYTGSVKYTQEYTVTSPVIPCYAADKLTVTGTMGTEAVKDTVRYTSLATTGIDEQVACYRFEWIDGVTYTESTDEPTFTLTNAAGCDSVVTLHLQVEFCDPTCGQPVKDADSISYPTAPMGNLCWMTANLRTTHYANGSEIPFAIVYSNPYNPNNTADVETYGRLYNWASASGTATKAASTTDATALQGICPDGWRLPTQAEFEALNQQFSEMQLRSADNWVVNPGNNESGFNKQPGGFYNAVKGRCEELGTSAHFYTADFQPSGLIYQHTEYYCDTPFYDVTNNPSDGRSIRCVRNLGQ